MSLKFLLENYCRLISRLWSTVFTTQNVKKQITGWSNDRRKKKVLNTCRCAPLFFAKVETVFTARERLISSNWILKIKKRNLLCHFFHLCRWIKQNIFFKENSLQSGSKNIHGWKISTLIIVRFKKKEHSDTWSVKSSDDKNWFCFQRVSQLDSLNENIGSIMN